MQFFHFIRKFLVTSIISMLAGCVLPSSNMGSTNNIAQAAGYTLPSSSQGNSAVVYLVQPYKTIDVAFIGGAMSDGFQYSGSNVTVTQSGKTNKTLLGKLNQDNTLCFNAPAGLYTLTFDSPGGVPSKITQNIQLSAGSTHIYALASDTPATSKSKLFFSQLSLNEGKYYVSQQPPAQCKSLQTLETATRIYTVNFTVTNHTLQTYRVSGNDSNQNYKKVELLPNQSTSFSSSQVSNKFEFFGVGVVENGSGVILHRQAYFSLENYNDKKLKMDTSGKPLSGGTPTTVCTQQQQDQHYIANCHITLNG